jgi:copper chaperone NosL
MICGRAVFRNTNMWLSDPASRRKWRATSVGFLCLVMASGCGMNPRAIRYGEESCEHCRMLVADQRFGAEVVLSTGRVLVFDAVECMASFEADGTSPAPIHSRWLTDFAEGELIEASTATILRSRQIRSPMGRGLAAFGPIVTPESLLNAFGGEVLTWDDVSTLAGTGWPVLGASPEMVGEERR